MLRLLKRSVETAVKLPFAMAWDVVSLGNMGEGTSTEKILREHRDKKCLDDTVEALERFAELRQAAGDKQ